MLRVCPVFLVLTAALVVFAPDDPSEIVIDYPARESIFPPDMAPPTFLWIDTSGNADSWKVDVTFGDGSPALVEKVRGERLQVGEIDQQAVGVTNELPQLRAHEANTRTWTPAAVTWETIKKHSVNARATVTITGFVQTNPSEPVSRGQIRIQTAKEPVGAPIFYRDVPLIPTELQKGVIKPIAPEKLPAIAWRLRNVSQSQSRLLLTGLNRCANCHSFSADGKTLGMDLDGPGNDKGLYALAEVKPQLSIRNQDVVPWGSMAASEPDALRVGFMSQVSPDGRYVVTTVKPPSPAVEASALSLSPAERLAGRLIFYVANFKEYRFLQVFYATRGILMWYDRVTRRLQPLPGADDPRFVHANSTWSPDGKYLVFVRAEAKEPYPWGSPIALYANDPRETPIQYDLYRIPFNEGKGGIAEPIDGASRNGKSNSFPKVSPDGRWIVFVQARNGLLMRPDGQLYIVPWEGGQARLMDCNTPLMNSWHSFSPNGRWLVFSSKSRSPYTRMFLTHVDESGNDSPPILVENATAANRAVNIPEFVNIRADGLMKITVPAADFYSQYDNAAALAAKGQHEAAVIEWKKAIELNPEDARTRSGLAVSLVSLGRLNEAVSSFEKALALDPRSVETHNSYGRVLAEKGRIDEAIPHFEQVLAANPQHAQARVQLGSALAQKGRLDEAISHFQKVLVLQPEHSDAHAGLAAALSQKGDSTQAIFHYKKAVWLKPDSAALHNSLGSALLSDRKGKEAVQYLRIALEMSADFVDARENLAVALYFYQGKAAEALTHWRRVLAMEPNHLGALRNSAWALATNPDSSIRNGTEAIRLAEQAVQLSGGREPEILDALAAAYAEVGRFPKAVETARRGLGLAQAQNNQELAEALTARIAVYEAASPFREPLPLAAAH